MRLGSGISLTTVFAASLFSSFVMAAEMPPVGKVVWREYTPESFAELREKRQATLVFCMADWSLSCRGMDGY